MPKQKKPVVTFQQVLEQLMDTQRTFPAVNLHRFSDLEGAELAQLRSIWPKVDANRKASLLEDLEELQDSDTVVSFEALAKVGLHDEDPRVRSTSLRLLWESTDARLIPVFMEMLEKDAAEVVRASAATALGAFIYLGELEEIPSERLQTIEEKLLQVARGKETDLVRRRALESLGYSGREEVVPLIREAYQSKDKEWQASALFAMGRSADDSWQKSILDRLDAEEVDVQLEAIRAAGQLELAAAREPLLRLLDHPQDLDEEVRMAAAWSLSQIGGEDVRGRLERLVEETEDEDEADYIDMAIENLAFTEDLPGFGMFDSITGNPEEHTRIIDLTESDEKDEDEDSLTDDDVAYGSKN